MQVNGVACKDPFLAALVASDADIAEERFREEARLEEDYSAVEKQLQERAHQTGLYMQKLLELVRVRCSTPLQHPTLPTLQWRSSYSQREAPISHADSTYYMHLVHACRFCEIVHHPMPPAPQHPSRMAAPPTLRMVPHRPPHKLPGLPGHRSRGF